MKIKETTEGKDLLDSYTDLISISLLYEKEVGKKNNFYSKHSLNYYISRAKSYAHVLEEKGSINGYLYLDVIDTINKFKPLKDAS